MSIKPPFQSLSLFLFLSIILIQMGCDSLRFDPQNTPPDENGEGDIIYESLDITYPVGGESFDPGTTITIAWETTVNTCEWGVNIILVRDDDEETNIAINTPNDGSFDWYIDTEMDHDDDYQIRIDGLCRQGDFCNGCLYSQSPGTFTISQNAIEPYILVISPNGGENIEIGGDSVRVLWDTNLPDCFFGFKISLYEANEVKAALATGIKNDGDQKVFISNAWGLETGNNYRLFVESLCENSTTYCGGCYGDFSDGNFRLYSNEFRLVSPNGGEEWTRGETETISWTDDSTTQNVRLEIYKGGTRLQDIYYLLENEFSYDWAPLTALTPDDDYQIKITSWETSESDMSDNYFTIE